MEMRIDKQSDEIKEENIAVSNRVKILENRFQNITLTVNKTLTELKQENLLVHLSR